MDEDKLLIEFAKAALTGLLTPGDGGTDMEIIPSYFAEAAFEVADACVEEARKRGLTNGPVERKQLKKPPPTVQTS